MGEFLTKNAAYERIKFAQSKGVAPEQALRDLANAGYEVEGYNAEFSPLDTVKNAPGSLLEFGKAIWSAVSSPAQTFNALESVTKGALRTGAKAIGFQPAENEIAGTTADEQAFEAMVDFFVDRYGSTDKLLNTIEKDPVGFLSDASIVLSGGAGAVSKIPALSKIAIPAKITSATGKIASAVEGSKIPLVARTAKELSEIKTVADIPAKTAKFARILEPATAVTKTAKRLNKAVGLEKWANNLTKDITSLSNTAIRELGQEGVEFINKHGISGSLESMSNQLKKVSDLTSSKVDDLLQSFTQTFRHEDTLSFLNREIKTLAKFDKKTGAVIPKADLAQESIDNLNRMMELKQKYLRDGLTLNEMNEVKRLSYEPFQIYKPGKLAGTPKASDKYNQLDKLYKSTNNFIDAQAERFGVPGIKKLNKQTQYANKWKDAIDDRILVGQKRFPLWERLTLIGGVTGAAGWGNFAPLAGSLALIGAVEISRIPRIRTFLINRISLMTKTEFEKFLGDVEVFSKTRKMGDTLRKVRQEAIRYARPAGIVREKAEQERIPIQ